MPDAAALVQGTKTETILTEDDEDEAEPDQKVLVEGADIVEKIDYSTYKPKIVGNEWIISETDLCTLLSSRVVRNLTKYIV